MVTIVNQIHSIGDIMFLEPLFRRLWEKDGEKPIVPLRDHLMWLAGHIESADFRKLSTFNWKPYYENEMMVYSDYLPTRWANQILRALSPDDHHDFENCMLDKYRLASLDPMMWKTLQLTFNPKKATELMVRLNLRDTDEYLVYNQYSQAGEISIDAFLPGRWFGKKTVKMQTIPGYNLMDWYFVLKFATEIHTISTSTFYMMQAMGDLQAKIFIYPRPGPDGLRGISQLNPSFTYTSMPDYANRND